MDIETMWWLKNWLTLAGTVISIALIMYGTVRSIRERGVGWFVDQHHEPRWKTALRAIILLFAIVIIAASIVFYLLVGYGSPSRMWETYFYDIQLEAQANPPQIYQPCTADSPGLRAKFPRVMKEYRARLHKLEQKAAKIRAILEVKNRPSSPKLSFTFPDSPIDKSCYSCRPTLKVRKSKYSCYLELGESSGDWIRAMTIRGNDWLGLAKLAGVSIVDEHRQKYGDGRSGGSPYYAEAAKAIEEFPLTWMEGRLGYIKGLPTTRQFFKRVAESEAMLKEVGQLVPYQHHFIDDQTRKVLRLWLPLFWQASYYNMSRLETAVRRDKQYLYNKNRKLEGWFMRRWINAGRGKTGRDRLVLYRFWMWRIAHELKHPQAAAWFDKVISELEDTTTLKFKGWYLKQLL